MKKTLFVVGLSLIFAATFGFSEDSKLVELAKKEKERRQKVEATKTFTNQDIEEFKKKNKIEDTEEEETVTQAEAEQTTPPAVVEEEEEEQDPTQTEEYWRDRYNSANERLQAAQQKLDQLNSEMNDLKRAFYAEGDGVAQRGLINSEIEKRFDQIDSAKNELAAAQQALEDLVEEARRAGVPPGWVR